ncbi:MAG TPA: cytochrome c oxidase assembly protein [Micromonosporaceae bacterium]|jgi:putative copper resistance protein D
MASEPSSRSSGPSRLWWPAAVVAGVLVLALASWYGGGILHSRLTGLPDAGRVTGWGLPTCRFVADVAGAITVGGTVFAAFLLPGLDRTIGPAGYRLLRLSGLVALVWAVAEAALLVFTTSDILGRPPSGVSATVVLSFVTTVSQGEALALQLVLALVAAVVARVSITRSGACWAAVLSLLAVLPPAFTGHAAGAGNHQTAVSSLVIHVLAASLWGGGLAALLLVRPRRLLVDVAPRYSRLALVCFVAVAVSGVVNAAIRLGAWSALWGSSYGLLVFGKVLAILALFAFGALHRRWSLRRLVAGRAAAFAQLAAGELVLLAATFGLAVALSRTPTPVPANPVDPDAFTDLVGFALPPPPTVAGMLGQPLPDLMILTVVAGAALAYLIGVRRLRLAGHPWPWARTACWLGGLAVLAAVTNLGVARYAYLLFSVHMAQHMVLSMVVPGLLVAGAPVTLALRTLREPSDPAVRGPRRWLLIAVRSRAARVISHPILVVAVYVVSLYGLYFSTLLSTLMRSHLGHLAMIAHFVLSGYLLMGLLVGTDPGRRRLPPYMLILALFATMVFHAFFGVALMQSTNPVGGDWFTLVHPPWAGPLAADQQLAGGIAWSFGEIPAAVVMAVLVLQWIQADEREQRRLDRAADRAKANAVDDELTRYNAFLRQINVQAQREAPPTVDGQ